MSQTAHLFHSPVWVNVFWRSELVLNAPLIMDPPVSTTVDLLNQCLLGNHFDQPVVELLLGIARSIDNFADHVANNSSLATNLGLVSPSPASPTSLFPAYSSEQSQSSKKVLHCLFQCVFLDRVLWAHGIIPRPTVQNRIIRHQHSLTLFSSGQHNFHFDHFLEHLVPVIDSTKALWNHDTLAIQSTFDHVSQLTAFQGSFNFASGVVHKFLSNMLYALTGTIYSLEKNIGLQLLLFLRKLQKANQTSGTFPPTLLDSVLDTFGNFTWNNQKGFLSLWFHSVAFVSFPKFPGTDKDVSRVEYLQKTAIPISHISEPLMLAEQSFIRYLVRLYSSALDQIGDVPQASDETFSYKNPNFKTLIAGLEAALATSGQSGIEVIRVESHVPGFHSYSFPIVKSLPKMFSGAATRALLTNPAKRLKEALEYTSSNKRPKLDLGLDGVFVMEEPALPDPEVESPLSAPTPSLFPAPSAPLYFYAQSSANNSLPIDDYPNDSLPLDDNTNDSPPLNPSSNSRLSLTPAPRSPSPNQPEPNKPRTTEKTPKSPKSNGKKTNTMTSVNDKASAIESARDTIDRFFMEPPEPVTDQHSMLLKKAFDEIEIIDLRRHDSSKGEPLGNGRKRCRTETAPTDHMIHVWVPVVDPAGEIMYDRQTITVPFTNHSYSFNELALWLEQCGLSQDEPPSGDPPYCTTISKTKFTSLSIQEQRALWRKGSIHIVQDQPDLAGYDTRSSLELLKGLGVNMVETRCIYENQRATKIKHPMTGIRHGSLYDFFSMSNDIDKLDCNVLDIPLPWARGYLKPDFLRNLSLNDELSGVSAPVDIPHESLQWCLFATPPARTLCHIDAGKFHTWIQPQSDKKLWMIQQPSPEVEEIDTLYLKGGNWHGMILCPGDVLIMPANTNHRVVTLEESVTMGGHFYSIDNLERTMMAGLREHLWGDSVTNTMHPKSEAMIYRLGMYMDQVLHLPAKYAELVDDAERDRVTVPMELELETFPPLIFMLLNPERFIPRSSDGTWDDSEPPAELKELRQLSYTLGCRFLKLKPHLLNRTLELRSKLLVGQLSRRSK